MHLGMSGKVLLCRIQGVLLTLLGWVHIHGQRTAYTNYYKKLKPSDLEQWPPKYWKFSFETDGESPTKVAFTDARRFGRVRLVDCPGEDIRKHSPLVENGPDPVVDPEVFTEEYLRDKMKARHVPVKALLLDQAMISGIGNWVADETLYQAKLHPEQYCDDFDDSQIAKLYESIRYVCQTAVDKLADSDEFPEDWLFKHRWGKGAKGSSSKLPNGEKLAFITVGGRTSCYAPGIQKKTGKTAPGIKQEPLDSKDEVVKVSKQPRKTSTKSPHFDNDGEDEGRPAKKQKTSRSKLNGGIAEEEKKVEVMKPEIGRRRSTRLKS